MSEPRGRSVTMADVAALAEVSHQTVSRVVNGDSSVRPETAQRVGDAIRQLGYRRNMAARLLASTRSRTIGVMTVGSSQFGPSQVLLGLEKAARDAGYRLSVVSLLETTAESVQTAFDQLMENRPEAVVVVVPHESVSRIAQDLAVDVPVVVLEGDLSRTPLTAGVDNAQGARLATRHLLDLGHRSVAHIAGPPGWNEAVARTEGWRSELQAAGVDPPPLRWGGDWSARSGYRAGLALAREKDVTAVFAANDQMALGLCAALLELGRRVPDDVSIVGFDDVPEAEYFAPPLTTVRQDFAELGRRAMVLVERVLGGEHDPSVDLVPTTLVVRASTAPPAP